VRKDRRGAMEGRMNVVIVVVGIVAVVAVIQAAIWIPIGIRAKRRASEFWAAFDEHVAADAETVIMPREACVYRGGSGPYSAVNGNGSMALTSQRLVIRKGTGGVIEVPTSQIKGAHEAKVFLGGVVGNRVHVVVEIESHAEIGLFVDANPRWLAVLNDRR
jgi:hypothetical protein